MNAAQFYINGQWVKPQSQKVISVTNPANGSKICDLASANQLDVNLAVDAAKKAFKRFSQSAITERIEIIEAINNELIKRNDEIAAAISLEMGAPKGLAKNAQGPSGSQHFSEMLNVLKTFSFQEKTQQGTLVGKMPIGVCALITPWNWPMNQIATKVAPAIAAGCTMILKPSELAPLDALILAEIMDDVGLPAGVFNLINGTGVEIGDSLTSHPDIDMISFTGSTRAGVAISHAAAPTIKRVALELGGKSAGIVVGKVDANALAEDVVGASMLNSGQSCNALTRLLLPSEHYDEYCQAIGRAVDKITVDLPENDPYMGPLASEPHYKKVQHYIQTGIDQGATLLNGGVGKPKGLELGCFVKPTVFVDVTSDMTIAHEEIFGPVLSILKYAHVEDAIDIANDSEYGLSGYVWASDENEAISIASKIRTGMVHINGKGLDSAAPFGGFKKSGNGREWGAQGLHEFLEYQSIYVTDKYN